MTGSPTDNTQSTSQADTQVQSSRLQRITFFTAAAGFIGSAVIHVLAIAGTAQSGLVLGGMQILAIMAFAAAFLTKLFQRGRLSPGERADRLGFFRDIPVWLRAALALFLVYAMFSFVAVLGGMGGGSPGVVDGETVIANHGKIIRKIDAGEYNALLAGQTRLFSAYWLLFFGAAAAFSSPWSHRKSTAPQPTQPLPDSFTAPHISTWQRLIAGGMIFGYLSSAVPGIIFVAVGIFASAYLAFIPAVLFFAVTGANMLFRLRQVRYRILSARVDGSALNLEYLDYDTRRREDRPVRDLTADLKEIRGRGASIFSLTLTTAGRRILAQYNDADWTYEQLERLRDRIGAAK
ncbi:MAG: hypothetical protein HY042_07750 [Spirochaetia bacterium]|nr:hypothetical protein [Spirochaetia bacterium]